MPLCFNFQNKSDGISTALCSCEMAVVYLARLSESNTLASNSIIQQWFNAIKGPAAFKSSYY